jgi:hypothetical protein
MANTITSGWCYRCERRTALERRGINHVLHLLLSIVTAGIWVIVWILCGLAREPWRCRICGTTDVAVGEYRRDRDPHVHREDVAHHPYLAQHMGELIVVAACSAVIIGSVVHIVLYH